MNRWLQDTRSHVLSLAAEPEGSFVRFLSGDTYAWRTRRRPAGHGLDPRRTVFRARGDGLGYWMGESTWTAIGPRPILSLVRVAVRNLRIAGCASTSLFECSRKWASRLHHRLGAHYDERLPEKHRRALRFLGTDFYRLFLDSEMAYFVRILSHQHDSLEIAQLEKLDWLAASCTSGLATAYWKSGAAGDRSRFTRRGITARM